MPELQLTACISNRILSAITVHGDRWKQECRLTSSSFTTASTLLPMQHRFVRQSPVHVWTTRRNTRTPPLGAETHSPPRVGTPPFYSWEAEPHTSHPTLCCKVNVKWSQKIILPENLMIVSALHKICFSVMLWSLTLYSSSSLVCWCIQMRKTLILSPISPASFHVSSYPRFPFFHPFFLHGIIMHCVQIQLSNLHAKAAHQMFLWMCFSAPLRNTFTKMEGRDGQSGRDRWMEGKLDRGEGVVGGNLIGKKMKKEINKNQTHDKS